MKHSITINGVISHRVPFGENNYKLKMTVELVDVPNNIPLTINPRTQNMRTKTARAIITSIENHDPMFEVLNSGIKIIADEVQFKKNSVIVTFDDQKKQGILNGGHTYRAILEHVGIDYGKGPRVDIDIITGDDVEQHAIDIAVAQNSSVSLKPESILNARGVFEIVKSVISDQDYADQIAYCENEKHLASVRLLLALCMMMDVRKYSATSIDQPCDAYNSKRNVTNWYSSLESDKEYFVAITEKIPEFVDLFEYIQMNIKNWYDDDPNGKRKYSCRDIKSGRQKTFMHRKPLEYRVPDSYVYPIFAACRAALEVDDNYRFKWVVDPYQLLDSIGKDLAVSHLTNYSDARSSRDFMKLPSAWMYLYNMAKDYVKDATKKS